MKRILLVLAVAFSAALLAEADKVFMKSGQSFEGKIIEENDASIKLKMSKGSVTLKRDEIDHIEKGSSSVDDLDTLLETLSPANPASYADAAEACAAKGLGDGLVIERIANIAISLDPSLCGRAQGAIGDWYSAKGNKARAAEAYLAGFTADWKNATLREKFVKHRDALVTLKKSQMDRLAQSLFLAINDRLAEAMSGLQASANAPGANLISNYAPGYRSYAAFLADVRARVPCKSCGGKIWTKCYQCSGEGASKCSVCDGKGVKIKKVGGSVVDSTECGSCKGAGKIPCSRCKERPGWLKCGTCKGVVPNPSATWDVREISAFRDAIISRMQGSLPAEEQVGARLPRLGATTYDEAFTEDRKIVYSLGKWMTPEEKK